MAACACFGPNDSYFMNSPKQWSWRGLPEDLSKLFTTQPKVREVHEMALGPDGSFAAVYTNANGVTMLTRNNLPPTLDRWLVPVPGKGVSAQRDLR